MADLYFIFVREVCCDNTQNEMSHASSRMLPSSWAGRASNLEFITSRPLQPIRKDLMIRFRHDSSDGGDYGDAREVCEEICCAAER